MHALKNTLSFTHSSESSLAEIKLIDSAINLVLLDTNKLSTKTTSLLAQQYLCASEMTTYDLRKALLAKKEFVASRLLIKKLALKYLNSSSATVDCKQLIVTFNEKLKRLEVSYQNQLLPLTISLSHSHGIVFLGVAFLSITQQSTPLDMKLGVDIELISAKRNHQKLADHFFHQAEIDWVTAKGQTAFFRVWTLKEALAKAEKVSVASLLASNVFEKLMCLNYFSCHYQNQLAQSIFDISIVFDAPIKAEAIQVINLTAFESDC